MSPNKGSFLSENLILVKKIFQIATLSWKFELSCLLLWAGNFNFLLMIVIWNIFLSRIKLSDKKLPLVLIFENMHSFKIQPTFKPEINELFPAKNHHRNLQRWVATCVFWSHARKSHTQFPHRTHTYDIARVSTHVRNSIFEKIFLSLSSIVRPLFRCSLKSGLNWPKMEMSRMIMQARTLHV